MKQDKNTQSEEGSEVKEDKNIVKSTVVAWDVSKGICFTPGSLQTNWLVLFLPKYASLFQMSRVNTLSEVPPSWRELCVASEGPALCCTQALH